MKIFLSYKFRGVNKKKLKEKLELVSSALEKQGHETFVHFRDGRNWDTGGNYPLHKALKKTFSAIKDSDAVLAIVDNHVKSIGMTLEIGFAKALGKKIILLVSQDCPNPTLEAIASQVIPVTGLKNLSQKLTVLNNLTSVPSRP